MIKRSYVNKCGKLILGEGQKKNIKKWKDNGLGALLLPLAKAALSVFGPKKKENMARETE